MKTTLSRILAIFTFMVFITACNPNSTNETDKEHNTTKTDTLKTTPKPLTKEDAVKEAETKFKEYLPKILASHNADLDGQESYTGDFTGDGLEDVIIYFDLIPTPKDGGNTIVGQGLVFYKNTGTHVEVLAGFEPDYLFSFEDITDGKIRIEKQEYAPEDAHCCPSIITPQVLTISGNKVTATDANQAQQ